MTTDSRRSIGIDGSRLTVGERTGTETYTFQLLSAMARLAPPDQIRVYFNSERPPTDCPPIGQPVCIPFPRFWTHARLSWEMQRRPPGVLFVPAHVIPFRHPRSVVTIHDLGYLHFPESHPPRLRKMLDWTTRWSVSVSRRIIAISNATRHDLISRYGVPETRIDVIPHGVAAERKPVEPSDVSALRHRLNLPHRYILAVGTVQPRKNLGRLAAALSVVAQADLPQRLVIAGKSGWLANFVNGELRASGMSDRIVRLGYVADDDLPALYAGADVFCFPSLYEGFGLPVLEAMAHGTAVVASNSSAIPEVAGDAALLVDPTDVRGLGAALVRVLSDDPLKSQLIAAGRARVKLFPWERTATATLDVLRRVRDA